MSRRYAAVVRVWCDGAEPVRLRWRYRDYRVTEVLGRWVVARPWWAPESPSSEERVWRVEVVPAGGSGVGPTGRRRTAGAGAGNRVFELSECDRRWVLRAVVD